MQNPYTLTFGKEPIEYIKRIAEERQILEDFLSPNPPQQVYMISGVRGCGKTVFMTDISQEIGRDEDWIVVDLNPYKADLMQEAAAYRAWHRYFRRQNSIFLYLDLVWKYQMRHRLRIFRSLWNG